MTAIDNETEPLIGRAGDALRRIGRATRFYDHEWLAMNVGMGEFKCMLLLTGDEPLTVGGIARALSISEPAASMLVDKLVGRGLALRESDPADRRRTLVKPSREGQEWTDRLRLTRETQLHGLLNLLEQDDLRALVQGFEALAAAIERAKERA
jgi:DNA-binding MarR family transcriptional regulator